MAAEPDSDVMNYVVRMVIPMKREFGRALDVGQFLANRPYAIEVIQQAMLSKDDRLREYAVYVQGKLFGPRTGAPAGTADRAPAAKAGTPAPAPAHHAEPSPSPTDEELRAKMLDKYRSGLR
ncbi:MAG TPA: hypothetical protein VLJ58_06215 [Ramlibacter sp.]|nr:hypothetical protein [Ramlibacter sp.]